MNDQVEREAELVAGRYRVLRELARGGVGAVYEALDESTGKRVALKRLLRDAANKQRLALLFEAEYDTLVRLRHPRIVEVFDYGIDKRGPYFTMELLDGRDLGELEPIKYRDACRYLRDVASSLALLHTRQRLHRDLSPRNVRLTSDGRCRLLDFGTMANFGVADDIVGTPPMVPPEALRGAALDHRADLYSLGALAYRVLTSRYPYHARQLEDLPELWRTPPTPLRELAPDVPLELDELVMSMLSLDPAFRPNTTYEVIDRLTAIGELPPDEDLGLAAQGYLVGSRLIGRERQLETITRRIARAQRGHGCTVVIEGNPGVGKSRMLDEAALQAQLTGALTARVDARSHQGHYAVASALVKAILDAAPHDARSAAAPYLASLRQIFTAFAHDTRSAPPGTYAIAGAAPTRQQLQSALLNWLFDLSEDRTLVLLIDDLPRVDEASAMLLNVLTQTLPRHRILLIAARRLADKTAAPAGVDAIVAPARRLRLHRLRREGTLAVIQSLFGLVPNVELLADWIHEITTGSPMQIMELARHLVRENIVRFVDGLWVLPPNVPRDRLQGNLAATLSARAAALSSSERALAEALCVRSGTLPLPLCMKLSDDKDARALFRNLDELVAKGVLVSGAHGYHFGQDALRQVLLRQLPPSRARSLHLRLGETLLESGVARPEDQIEAGFNLILGGAEVRGADLVASAATKLAPRSVTTIALLPAIDAALELYEKRGRSPRERLRLRVVLLSAMDQRSVALYGDGTLEALRVYAGGQVAERLKPLLSGRVGFALAIAATDLQRRFAAPAMRGPRPRTAVLAFHRAAFGVVSARLATLDLAGVARLLQQAESLAAASPLSGVIASALRSLLLAARCEIAPAIASAHVVLERLRRDAHLQREAGPAAVGGILAAVHMGLGAVEAQYALRSQVPLALIEELQRHASAAHLDEPLDSKAADSGALSELELTQAVHQLRLLFHLARGERYQAEARSEPRRREGGMQNQFTIVRNAIDCKLSLRSVDVAGMRRCVELFTQYVAEHPELVPWLEIARAHLALCLGKPQEALASYEKWVARIEPGGSGVWDTLACGYADALLATGEAQRARVWLEKLLEHPVLRAAPDTTIRFTLEATLALAEAEIHALNAAGERAARLLTELDDSDHPLVLGFTHEVAARIAFRRRDEALSSQHLAAMKRWYGATRNAALLLRAQRVHDSLRGTRPTSSTPVDRERERDRDIVTRVTTRRDSPSEVVGGGTDERHHAHTLQTLLALASSAHGFLFAASGEGLQLAAASDGAPSPALERELQSLFEQHDVERASEVPDAGPGAHFAPVALTPERDARYALYWLRASVSGATRGAFVLRAETETLQPIAPEMLESVADTMQPSELEQELD